VTETVAYTALPTVEGLAAAPALVVLLGPATPDVLDRYPADYLDELDDPGDSDAIAPGLGTPETPMTARLRTGRPCIVAHPRTLRGAVRVDLLAIAEVYGMPAYAVVLPDAGPQAPSATALAVEGWRSY
jgi:hypothetical protein